MEVVRRVGAIRVGRTVGTVWNIRPIWPEWTVWAVRPIPTWLLARAFVFVRLAHDDAAAGPSLPGVVVPAMVMVPVRALVATIIALALAAPVVGAGPTPRVASPGRSFVAAVVFSLAVR